LAIAYAASSDSPAASPSTFLAFVVALIGTHLAPLHLKHRQASEALHVDEVLLLPMLLMLSPMQVVGAFAIAIAITSLVSRRGALKASFNIGMVTASAAMGVFAAHLVGLGGTVTSRDIAAAFLGGVVHCGASSLAVSVVIAASRSTTVRSVFLDGALLRAATWVGSLSLGVLVVMAAHQRPDALALAVVPVVLLQVAYAGALSELTSRQQADALYEAAERIHRTVETDVVRTELVRSARDMLSAGGSRVVDAGVPLANGALRAPIDGSTALEVFDPATGGSWSRGDEARLQALAAVASGALANAMLFEQRNAITASLGEGVVALDEKGVVTFANPAAESLLGWAPGELLGREIAEAVDPGGRTTQGDGGDEWVHLPRLRAGETLRIDEHTVTRRDGTPLDVAFTASPVMRDGRAVGAVVVVRDMRDRKALERRLVHQAFHDHLTGLPNRALFLDRIEHARMRAQRDGGTQAVLFVDVDRFKVINDSLGHRTGDLVLQLVAERIVQQLRPSDTVARFGGDEFTVLLEQVHDTQDAVQTAERLVRAFQRPFVADGREVVVTVSVGIAVAEPLRAPADLLAAADIAMYQAKSHGRNGYRVAAHDADEHARARLDLETELRHAIAEGQLEVHYQPVVHAHTDELYGLEALVRWRHPTLGLLAPAHFMDVAEESGLVLPLGSWVMEQACAAAVAWREQHPDRPVVMAVNLSGRQFQQPDLCEHVAGVLERTGLDPQLLSLEITETVVMEDTRSTQATLRALKKLKVRLAIDDFGTGYSSLSYLKRFPVDTVKIDKSFVDGVTSGLVDREIVQAVIRLARAVGMQTIAEGVETAEQRQTLRDLGCSLLQGYLHARPAPLAALPRSFSLDVPAQRAAAEAPVVPAC
jgi:diguanylate cyclase (GGDEF)-like protein/PAS domain S-box-containing protein